MVSPYRESSPPPSYGDGPSWQAVVVLVASLLAIVTCAVLKLPGAAVAAVAAPGIVLNWLTQGPKSKKTHTSLFPPPMPPEDP